MIRGHFRTGASWLACPLLALYLFTWCAAKHVMLGPLTPARAHSGCCTEAKIEITSWKARGYGIFTRVAEVSEIERVSATDEWDFRFYQRVWKSRTKRFLCCNLFILYILRFSLQILLFEKAFRILLKFLNLMRKSQYLWNKFELNHWWANSLSLSFKSYQAFWKEMFTRFLPFFFHSNQNGISF